MTLPATMLLDTLKANGYSHTAVRMHVFAALEHQEPLTMHELVERCGNIDRASVYRTIDLFEHLGIVQRLQTGWKYKLELAGDFHAHHHHATCLECGASFALPEDDILEERLRTMAASHMFTIERHQLELQGTCHACTKNRP